jgi:four helix bundle protein
LSIKLKIAEGSSRFTDADDRNFYVIARGSTFECVSVLDLLCVEQIISIDLQKYFYAKAEIISKMLFKLINNLEPKKDQKDKSKQGLKTVWV